MSWLERVNRPKPPREQSTTIVFHRNDCNEPIVHNLQGLWFAEALRGVLVPLVQEYYQPGVFQEECEVLWQDGTRCWGQEVGLDIHLPDC